MGKLYGIDFSVFMNCTVIWLFIYGCFVVVVEVVNLYVTIILLLTSVFTYILVCHLAVPQPTPNILNEVLGSDPRAVKQKDLETKNTNDNYQQEESENVFKVFAHRGAGLDAPENSIAAFRKCHEKGCLAVEFDLVLTADDIPVVFHDSTVDRITNGTGAIQNLTWDELQTYDISVKHPLKERFVGEKIALFSDVVELCLELNMRMVIDIKEQQPKIVKVVLDIFKSHPQLYRRAMVSAFNPLLIYMIRKQDPTIVCSLAWRPHFYSYSEYNLQTGCKRRYQSFPQHCLAHCMDIISTWFLHNIFYFTIGISAILLHKDTVTQYLATGNSIRSLHFEFLLGRSTISSIIRGTCTSICEVMKGEYMRQPTVEEWKAISDQYEIRANFPHCLGAIDGKHIRIIKPWGSGSEYFNYKKFFSIVLMAVVDSNYYFRYIDVGSFGHEGDSNILTTTKLGKQIYQQALNLPQPVPLPNDLSGQPMPYVFVADEAFAMCENVMRPYPARKLTWQQRVFNYRMSRARRYVECGFGILANKWHILH